MLNFSFGGKRATSLVFYVNEMFYNLAFADLQIYLWKNVTDLHSFLKKDNCFTDALFFGNKLHEKLHYPQKLFIFCFWDENL